MYGTESAIRDAVEKEVREIFNNAALYKELHSALQKHAHQYGMYLASDGTWHFVVERGRQLGKFSTLSEAAQCLLGEIEARIKAQASNE